MSWVERIKIFVLSVAVLFCMGALTGCHNPYRSGMEALSQNNWTEAEERAGELLNESPRDPSYHLLMAEALVGQERYREAESHAQAALDSGELDARAGRVLGKVLWELGRPIEVVESWRTARAADPTSVDDEDYVRALETALAMASSVRKFEQALEFRRELRKLDAGHSETSDAAFQRNRMQLAEELVREGELQRASELYGQLYTTTQDDENLLKQGTMLVRLKKSDEARRVFESYVNSGDDDSKADRNSAVAAVAQREGSLTLAVYFFDQAISAMPDEASMKRAGTHLRLATLLLSLRAADDGRAQLRAYIADRRAIEGEPVSSGIYLQAAQVASRERAPNIAIELLEEALVEATPQWRTARQLADLYARRARANDVERVVRTYVERAGSTTTAQLEVGRWAASRRDFELAQYFLEGAVESEGTPASVWLELARVYSASGRVTEMRGALGNYAKVSDDERRALLDIAGIYRGQRMYDEAEKALLRLFAKDETDLSVARQLETLYQEWGRPSSIHDVYEKWLRAGGRKASDYMLVGERFLRQNEWQEALPYFRQAAERGANEAWLQIADVYRRQRKSRDMVAALDSYLDGADDRQSALNSVWQRYKSTAWRHEAIPLLEELISLDPRNVLHYEALSTLYFEQGRDIEAFELWKSYIDLSRDPLQSLEQMARRFQRQGHSEWMLTFLHQVLDKEENPDPRVYRLLGDSYHAAAGRHGGGMLRVSNAIFSEQDNARRYYHLYLEHAEPSRRQLQGFADDMRRNRIWDVAASAYGKLDLASPVHTQQLLSYADVLLHLGRTDEAAVAVDKYYERRGGSVDAARRIASVLQGHRQYDLMERYLKKMMDSGDESLLRTAFLSLGEAYRQTDQQKKIVGLIDTYLAKTQNPSEARRTTLEVLENAGMWKEAVRQLERVVETQGDQARFELGHMLYRAGEFSRADEAFRDFASGHVNAAEAWFGVAGFYESHGHTDKASDAYNLAVSAGVQEPQFLAERARFRIAVGRIDEGRADFTQARSNVDGGQAEGFWRQEIEALVGAGRVGEAADAARAALPTAVSHRSFFYRIIAFRELQDADNSGRDRVVDELIASGIDVTSIIEILVNRGFTERAIELIEAEVGKGDVAMSGQLIVSFAHLFTERGGIDRLLRVSQPLLDRSSRDGRFEGLLGEYLIKEGRLDRGALLLRAALDRGETRIRPLLARTYLHQGYFEEASMLFQGHLAEMVAEGHEVALMNMAQQYEVAGERSRLLQLLRKLSEDSRFARLALPMLIQGLVEENRVREATSTLFGLLGEMGESQEGRFDLSSTSHADTVVLGGIEVLAASGYSSEARAVLDRLPPRLEDEQHVRDLRIRLASAGILDLDRELEFAFLNVGDSKREASQRLRVADLLLAGGHFQKAVDLARPFLSAGDVDLAPRSLRILMSADEARGVRENFDGYVEEFVGAQSDKSWARGHARDILTNFGADDHVVRLTRANFERVPSETQVRRAFFVAQQVGEPALFEDAFDAFWRVARSPVRDSEGIANNLIFKSEPESVKRVIDRYRDAFPQAWDMRKLDILLAYRDGRPEYAREEILDYLEAVEFESVATLQVLSVLSEMKLWGEIASVVGPVIPEQSRSPYVRRHLGIAQLNLGRRDAAISALDRYVETAPEPGEASTELASTLLDSGFEDLALRFAERAVQRSPGHLKGYLVRGLSRLATDDLDGARADFERTLTDGHGRYQALQKIGRIALERGEDAFAFEHLSELAGAPMPGPNPLEGMRFALMAFDEAGRHEAAIEFLESRFPHIAAGHGIAGQESVITLASVYELAGRSERSHAIYRDAIARTQLLDPFGSSLSTYRNNLAYSFSTTGRNIEEGIDLVRLAIVTSGSRSASFIDTLGWLYYRQGNYAAAEAEIRKALRATRSEPAGLVEIYEHLAELRRLQGYSRDAAWIEIFLESIRR